MTTLHLDSLRLPSADLGPLNPLAPLVRSGDPHEGLPPEIDDPAMLERVGYGRLRSLMPYLTQDGYHRVRTDREQPTAVLENELLRATFLLGLGGRLWSLIHKPTGRELLYRNSVFQPGNLGLRNAWFAGGAEWNLGTTGHTALTCEPLHAVRVDDADGTPVLRLYEYERSRELLFSIDFSLPEGSAVLLAAVRITNPNADPVPLYWWSNIAVPEHDDVRVIAPANQAFHYAYDRGLHVIPVPEHGGRDVSYPATAPGAADWFFDCRAAGRPWIAALDGEGHGLVHVSTERLVGRKLFAWGNGVGGRNWQEFLCGPGERYLEIQGGAAATQFEHERLAAGETCSWVEAFGFAEADPQAVHGAWGDAQRAVERVAKELAPRALLENELAAAARRRDLPPTDVLHRGSGWGALEERRRELAGEPALASPGTPFIAETLGPEQAVWMELLATGELPVADPDEAPRSYVVGEGWRRPLESAGDDWNSWMHRGLARWHAGDRDGAYAATARSVELQPTAWSLRNLAAMERAAGRADRAAEHFLAARKHAPELRPLLIETLVALIEAGSAGEALEIIDALDARERVVRRVRMIELRAALASGELERAAALLEGHLVAELVPDDLQEGEDSLFALWTEFHALRGTDPVPALPAELDFRMG
ncbi:DUF5107 domain-containing protein [Agromyces subbeticus]|uniref:DUF5107 domain-containing protein n=1 Tax=Agromyces subbeticus TaxID=293890 RepID=UPI0003B7A274|nr:DUF5107 domain-containing protein [Agromyces subbeticus]